MLDCMAHITQMAGAISDHDKRKKVTEHMSGPMPKLGFAYVPAEEVESSYSLFALYENREALADVDSKGYTKKENKRFMGELHPVTVRLFNIGEAVGIHEKDYLKEDGSLDRDAWRPKQKELNELHEQMFDELQKLGSRAFPYSHHYQLKTGHWDKHADGRGYDARSVNETQNCLVLPCTYPTTEPYTSPYDGNPHFEEMQKDIPRQHFNRDIEGAGLFLAYLMAKKMVTPDEIEKTFGYNFLEEACKREHAEKIKERLGLDMPLPNTAKYTGRNTSTQEHTPG